jgi:hypothetical protein
MKLTIDISRQDYVDFNKFHFYKTHLKRTVITGIVTVILMLFILNRRKFDMTLSLVSSIGSMLVYTLAIYWNLNRTKNIPNNDGTILGEKNFEFTEDKIIYKTVNSEGSSSWSSIMKFEESSKAFYLYMDTNMAMPIPKRFFKDKTEEDAFRTLVRQKIRAI